MTILCFGIISCIKQSPQLPSNKVIEKNNDHAALLKINSNLTKKEDSILAVIAEKKGSFKKNDIGFWYHIFKTGKAGIKRRLSSPARAITQAQAEHAEFS